MATQVKINVGKATAKQLFKAVVRVSDELNETTIVYGPKKRRLPISPIAQAPDFHVPNQVRDQIPLKKGLPYLKSWSDYDLSTPRMDWKFWEP